MHKTANVVNCLPKSAQPAARRALTEIRDAEDRGHAETALGDFERVYGTKYPKAVAKIRDDQHALLAFYDFPAEHWIHLKTTNPIESRSPPCGSARRSPKAPAAGLPDSPWPTSCSKQPKRAGAPSTDPTWSRSSAQAPRSRREPSSNGPPRPPTPNRRRPPRDQPRTPHPQLLTIPPINTLRSTVLFEAGPRFDRDTLTQFLDACLPPSWQE